MNCGKDEKHVQGVLALIRVALLVVFSIAVLANAIDVWMPTFDAFVTDRMPPARTH